MCQFKALGVSWPPRGWKQLEAIKKTYGQSIVKDPATARVEGLSYLIEPIPVYQKNNKRVCVYSVQIDGWEYTIHNESREFPILSFLVQDRLDISAPKNFYISDIKSMARPVRLTERSAHRSMMAAIFIIKQITMGQVPNADRALRLYKIHPTQRSLYDIDNARSDSLCCGLPYVGVDKKESDSA